MINGCLCVNPSMLTKFGLVNSKHARTPICTSVKISKDVSGKQVDLRLYRSMIGSLLYLTATRPDISFSVGLCARFQSTPTESHLHAIKRVCRYIVGTINYGLWYTKDTNLSLVGYSDADWAGSVDDKKKYLRGVVSLWEII